MFFTKKAPDKTNTDSLKFEPVQTVKPTEKDSEAERRRAANRSFYEHLARGNALAEAEDNARRKWQCR